MINRLRRSAPLPPLLNITCTQILILPIPLSLQSHGSPREVILLSLGVASFFVDHPGVMTAIQCVGVLFIGYLAVGALRDAWRSFRGNGTEALHPAQAKGWALVRRGVAMSMSNPLTILFFLAFLPNFTRDGATLAPAVQTFLLGTLFCALVPWIYLPVIFAAMRSERGLSAPLASPWVSSSPRALCSLQS